MFVWLVEQPGKMKHSVIGIKVTAILYSPPAEGIPFLHLDDFRLFCGDLGNEVNDDALTRAFNKYPSFQKARVVRDKRSGKTRGYGFISFKDSQDYIRAMREMNGKRFLSLSRWTEVMIDLFFCLFVGKYVGNRPIKLRKSTWQERNIDIVRKKVKDKVKMGLR